MVDALVVGFAVVALTRFIRKSRPIGPVHLVFLVVLTGCWLWANLRTAGWQEEFHEDTPEELFDPITKAMFWRGWPLAPVMVCLIHGNRLRPNGLEGFVLIFDGGILLLGLFLAGVASRQYHRRHHRGLMGVGNQPEEDVGKFRY